MGLRKWMANRTQSSGQPDFVASAQAQLGTDRITGMISAMNQAADQPNQLFAAGLIALGAGGPDRTPLGGDIGSVARSIPCVVGRTHLIAVSDRRVSWFDISTGVTLCVATVQRATLTMSRTGRSQPGHAEVRFAFSDGSFVLYLCSRTELVTGFWDSVG